MTQKKLIEISQIFSRRHFLLLDRGFQRQFTGKLPGLAIVSRPYLALIVTEKLFDFILPIAQASDASIKRVASWIGLFVTNAAQVSIVGHRPENRVAGV